jgi:hypothetical protein
MNLVARVALLAVLVSSAAAPAAAQCGQWDPELSIPGIGGPGNPTILCSAVHDDGSGDKLYVGGIFDLAGGVLVNNVAVWDGSSWSALGTGTNGMVRAMAFYDDGGGAKLYIGGEFTTAGGVPVGRIARWDGGTWSDLTGGFVDGAVFALAVASVGGAPALYAGGSFVNAATVPLIARVAKWNGSAWSKLSNGTSSITRSLGVWDEDGAGPGGDILFASGDFFSAGGVAASRIARWDGSSWSALGAGLASGPALAMLPFDDGGGTKLIVGGSFNQAGGNPMWNLASWNGSSWAGVGPQCNGPVESFLVHDDGSGPKLYAGGQFTGFGATAAHRIGSWDGASWQPVGLGIDPLGLPEVNTMATYTDADGLTLAAAGIWHRAGGLPSEKIALWRSGSIGVNYCTAKVTSDGCVPAMFASGTPSHSAPGGFTVGAASVRSQVNGLLFFSLAGPQWFPFQGGYLCIKSPNYRLALKNSGGSAPCTGRIVCTLADMQAHASGGALISVGSRVDVQAWFRDPPSPSGTGLSDGLDFFVCP